MKRLYFQTDEGVLFPAVNEDEMLEIDRLAVDEYQLGILQMMENAGRNLALLAGEMLKETGETIVVLAGKGGNGGGGLCSARHLLNHGYKVEIILASESNAYQNASGKQLALLESMKAVIHQATLADTVIPSAHLIIDALIGYSLRGAPSGAIEKLIHLANQSSAAILSLDLPSGMEATHGHSPGNSIRSDTVMTLALPKSGLSKFHGQLHLADIGIPPNLYHHLGLEVPPFPPGEYIKALHLPT